jgi:hypothetical protein
VTWNAIVVPAPSQESVIVKTIQHGMWADRLFPPDSLPPVIQALLRGHQKGTQAQHGVVDGLFDELVLREYEILALPDH